jgi:hypothetical protein
MQKKQRIDEVLDTLEQERQRVERDLQRLTAAAAYLGAVLAKLNHRPARSPGHVPTSKTGRRAVRRRRCDPRRR